MVALIIAAIVCGLALLLLLVYLLVCIRPTPAKKIPDRLLCDYAHRGLHNREIPENSLSAFERACQQGFGIELDVQLSRDGCVMVFHDASLKRMTGVDRLLCEMTAEELSHLRLANSSEKIPTLTEVLALVNGRVPLLVELKGETTNTALCAPVAELLKNYKGDYCVESFNPLLVGSIKKQLPHVVGGLLYTNVCRDKKKRSALNLALTAMALNVIARPNFIACNKADRSSFPVWVTTKLYRAPRFVWTVTSKAELEEAHQLGEYPIFENCDR